MTEERLSSTHPPLPPTTEDDRLNWLRLLRSRRVGIVTFYRLMSEHGTAQAALDALPGVARAAGVPDYEICPRAVVLAEMKSAHRARARMLCIGDPDYPAHLAAIDSPPPILWCIGDTSLLQRPLVAMVGARNASSLGTRMTKQLATDLSTAGLVVVSGLARGVDACAHMAALDGGTVAVQAGGVDVVYPAENSDLADQIALRGLRLSDQPMGTQPQARHFPARNRIISGLGQAVIVVEAAAKSGSLITARNALDQGRDVLAVPGHPFDARAAGCNMLLRDGATLVRCAQDVLDALAPLAEIAKPQLPLDLPPPAAPRMKPGLRDTAKLHSRILSQLGPSPLAEDQLIRDLARPATEIAPVLLDLELDGKIMRQPGGLLSRVN